MSATYIHCRQHLLNPSFAFSCYFPPRPQGHIWMHGAGAYRDGRGTIPLHAHNKLEATYRIAGGANAGPAEGELRALLDNNHTTQTPVSPSCPVASNTITSTGASSLPSARLRSLGLPVGRVDGGFAVYARREIRVAQRITQTGEGSVSVPLYHGGPLRCGSLNITEQRRRRNMNTCSLSSSSQG